ncbi:hypothetical protein OAO48_01715 [Alphaproteobacteria bacterium]|nr:hypothetical protein [Alphaproteobacteria bacterium]
MSLTTYNSIWGLINVILTPYLERRIKRGKEDIHRINERYGVSKKKRPNGTLIWLHGTSVGESVAALALANSMRKNGFGKHSSEFFLLTTNTLSAAKLIKNKIKKGLPAIHQYHPYDHPKFVSKFLKHWQPNMAVFLESDFWPNLIYLTSNAKIPTILASSQMSDKSARFWTGLGYFLAKKVFGRVDHVLAVDPKQGALFKKLGAKNVRSLTSLKSIAEKPPINRNYIFNLKKNLAKKKILLAASTHPGEEELMIKLAYLLRKNSEDNVLIIIAPRHIRRSLSIQSRIKAAGFDIKSRSKGEFPSKNDPFYLADTMGEMGSLMEVANLVYVAGSMVPAGGHSPSEASQFGKPVIMGPHTEKCNAQIKDLVWSGGAIQIEKKNDMNENFIDSIFELLSNPERLEDMSKNSLIASGYAQQRADEASVYLLKLLMKRDREKAIV